jgi:hypothetical protein
MLKLFRNRHVHVELVDDTDDATGGGEPAEYRGDSTSALLPHSNKTAFRAILAQMGMILALVRMRVLVAHGASSAAALTRAQVHRSSTRNLRGTVVGACTVTLVVQADELALMVFASCVTCVLRTGHVRVSAAEHRGALTSHIHNPG